VSGRYWVEEGWAPFGPGGRRMQFRRSSGERREPDGESEWKGLRARAQEGYGGAKPRGQDEYPRFALFSSPQGLTASKNTSGNRREAIARVMTA
jgi:hypothetical protein